jgi:F-type H+-transporting ATPase subunit a
MAQELITNEIEHVEGAPVVEEGHTETEAHSPIHISLSAEKLGSIGGFPITNAILMSALTFVVLASIAVSMRRKVSLIPGKVQSIFEMIFEMLLELMDSVLGSREKSEKYFPLIMTIFLFVVTSNWLGLLPGVGSLTRKEGSEVVPFLRSGAADLNFTLAIGIIAVVGINFFGVVALGFRQHAGKFFNFKGINSAIGLLEFLSEFSKIISFSFRLFGNVFAGEVLLTIVAFLVPYVVPLPFLFLEIFVGFIQGFVFAMLSLVFVGIAITGHDEHEEHHEVTSHSEPKVETNPSH